MTTEPEATRMQLESLRALRQELALKEKELADQKWILELILQSPTWRFSYPLRWAASRLRNLRKGSNPVAISGKLPEVSNRNIPDLKSFFAQQYRVWFESFLVSGSRLELPHSDSPRISLLLVLYNRAELTFACLRSIVECRGEEMEVIIVDNASSDGTSKLLERIDGARIIRNSENLNFLLAANQAARAARGDTLLFLNNDAQLLPGTIHHALHTLNSLSDIGAVGGKIVLLDGTLQEAGSIVWKDGSCAGYGRGDDPMGPAYMFRRDVDYCSGAFLMTPRRLWNQLGGFDEAYLPAYYEEADYCMRLWKDGYRVIYEPDAIIIHYEFASSVSSSRAIKLQAEHQQIFAERHKAALLQKNAPGIANTLKSRSRFCGERILFLDDRVPHVWLGSGFPRARTILLSLVKQGYFITMYPLSEAAETWDQVYSDIPREVEVMTGLGSSNLEPFLKSRRDYYSCIVVSRPHNMRMLQLVLKSHPDWFENIHIVYDAEALFSHRDAKLREISGKPWSKTEAQAALAKEIALAESADCVISVSQRESAVFSECGIRNVHVVGHAMSVCPDPANFENRSGLLFVGAIHFEASPNGDSIIWFLTDIFPKIQQQLGKSICLTIAGVINSSRIRELAGPGVHFTGHLPSLDDLYAKARLFVAPTRYSAGLPHKIHEAAARGLPVVATPLLAGQLDWSERELAIGGDAESFAARCVELYSDPEKWMALRNAALERVAQDCSPEIFEKNVQEVVRDSRRA